MFHLSISLEYYNTTYALMTVCLLRLSSILQYNLCINDCVFVAALLRACMKFDIFQSILGRNESSEKNVFVQ